MSFRNEMRYMNPFDIHKKLINDYILKRPGDTKLLARDKSKDKNDLDVLKEHHRFLWEDESAERSWEEEFAKKYYDKLFKEYCISDLSYYKENKIAMRWRTEAEVVSGKGQFVCANKKCSEKEDMRTWEVNFVYLEGGAKKNALVKIRLCPGCSKKINYHSKKREVKRLKTRSKKKLKPVKATSKQEQSVNDDNQAGSSKSDNVVQDPAASLEEESPWEAVKTVDVKTREEEMEEYLQDLLL